MRLVFLALRNLTRNKRRTFVTALAIAFGATAIITLQGISNSFLKIVVEVAVLSRAGPVQVFARGYLGADDPLKESMPDDADLRARIAGVPGVTAVAPRINFDGMLSNGIESAIFIATAIEPASEYRVCPKRATEVEPGSHPLRPGSETNALVGKTLTDALGAKQGSTLAMQAAGPRAGTNALDVDVTGFLPSFNPIESQRMATVTLSFAQDLLRMKGRVTEYVVGVEDLDRVDEVAGRVRAALGPAYQVTTWREMDPVMRDKVRNMKFVLGFIALILFLLVGTGIVNTMMMSVYERVREIGTMMAVGVRRGQIRALFLWEAVALGLLSAAIGAGPGWLAVRAIARHGIAMQVSGMERIVAYPEVGLPFIGLVVCCTVLGAVLAALYPAWRASRLKPVDALRAT